MKKIGKSKKYTNDLYFHAIISVLLIIRQKKVNINKKDLIFIKAVK